MLYETFIIKMKELELFVHNNRNIFKA